MPTELDVAPGFSEMVAANAGGGVVMLAAALLAAGVLWRGWRGGSFRLLRGNLALCFLPMVLAVGWSFHVVQSLVLNPLLTNPATTASDFVAGTRFLALPLCGGFLVSALLLALDCAALRALARKEE